MDVSSIYAQAKETILETGDYIPTLFVEFAGLNELVIAPIMNFGHASFDKQHLLFTIGRTLGKHHLGLKVQVVAFACEAWMSVVREGEPFPHGSPSQDPNHKEALIVAVLDASTPPTLTQELYRAELLRDGSGQLVDLLASSQPLSVNYNKLLTAFFAGALSATLSDEEFARLLQQFSR